MVGLAKPGAQRRKRKWSWLFLFLVVVVGCWCLGILLLLVPNSPIAPLNHVDYMAVEALLHEFRHESVVVSSTTEPPLEVDSQSNISWDGWQPKVYPDDVPGSCKVRDCLANEGHYADHSHCPNCHDDPQEFLKPPKVPSSYVPDPTILYRMRLAGHDNQGNPWPPPLSQHYCETMGPQGGPNDPNQKLLDGVPIRGMPIGHSQVKLFCGVYTLDQYKGHNVHSSLIRAMRETWASHCDGFVAFSNLTDPRIPALNIPHEGPEAYENMWQKSRAIWKYIGQHYLEDYDYFILGGEDLMVIPENLKRYLEWVQQDETGETTRHHRTPDDDLFAGRRFKGYGRDNYFNSGGAGYVLSRGTLRKFYEQGLEHSSCHAHSKTAMEDVMIASCLRDAFHIGLVDTRDDQQRERFHPFAPGHHYNWRFPKPPQTDWYEDYNKEWGLKLGLECCAPDSVSFHYIKKPATVRHLWSLLYFCGK